MSTIINNDTGQKSKEEQPQQQIIAHNTPSSVQSNSPSPSPHQTMNGDTVIISQSTMNINDPEISKNYSSLSVRPLRTIVERNGKQFLVESKDRIEQRYVQYTDEISHQKRLFEVIDCIPYRIIRPYQDKSQSLSPNDLSQNTLLPTLQSNQCSLLPPVHNYQLLPSYVCLPAINTQPKDMTQRKLTDNRTSSKYSNNHIVNRNLLNLQ